MKQLRGIEIFVRSAQTCSFSKAALELGMTPQSVSSQVKSLEDRVGVRLFHRNTRKISLTEEGWHFYERCRVGINSIEEGFRNLTEATDEVFGIVRLAAPYAICRGFITPILAEFLEQYPRVSIELITHHQTPDIVEKGVDLGITSGHLPQSSITARKIASVELILCAAPSYLETHGVPTTMEDLYHHRCVTLRHPHTGKIMPWTFQNGKDIVTLDINGSLVTSDTDTQRQAVLAGAGIGQLASFFVSPQTAAGRLKPLLIGYIAPPVNFYLYLPRRSKIPRKTRALADFLYGALKRNKDFEPMKLR
jgi:DNA-binding transcriptional LysR family regulator